MPRSLCVGGGFPLLSVAALLHVVHGSETSGLSVLSASPRNGLLCTDIRYASVRSHCPYRSASIARVPRTSAFVGLLCGHTVSVHSYRLTSLRCSLFSNNIHQNHASLRPLNIRSGCVL